MRSMLVNCFAHSKMSIYLFMKIQNWAFFGIEFKCEEKSERNIYYYNFDIKQSVLNSRDSLLYFLESINDTNTVFALSNIRSWM